MRVERITASNRDMWIDDVVELGNAFLKSIGVSPVRDAREDRKVIELMIAADQTEIFLAIGECGRSVGMTYFNSGTGFSCGGNYIWINGVFVRPEYRGRGHGASLLAAIESFGESIGSQLIMSTRDIDNLESGQMFSKGQFIQEEQIVITKPTHNE